MKIYKSGDVLKNPAVVMLGMFDGIHKGHVTLAERAVSEAEKIDAEAVMYTFAVNPKVSKKQLMSAKAKTEKCACLGLDAVYFEEFSEEFRHMSPKEFIEKIIIKRLNAKAVVVGESYRFGFNHSGSTDDLFGYGFQVFIMPEYEIEGMVVSSSKIRELLEGGNIGLASKMLGYNYALTGQVAKGRCVGRKLGARTANVDIGDAFVCPKPGVYATYAYVEGVKYKSVTNVGFCPTFGLDCKTVECHIFDFDGDIYNSEITVEFVEYLRGEIKFETPIMLMEQIKRDAEAAKRLLGD